jgi:hypothetical protein
MTKVDRALIELRTLRRRVDALEAARTKAGENRPQPTPVARRRQRWTGPVSAEVHAERGALYHRRFSAAMALGLDATAKVFAARHNLNVSEVSRWLSLKERGIAPGSSVDTSIRRALQEDIVKYEALRVTRQGAAVFPNSSPRVSRSISA